MELFYAALAGTVLSAAAIIKGIDILRSKSASSDLGFKAFRNNYVLIVTLMMAADWLQGPYVYALYESYGFTRGEIGHLFIAGFGSSLALGTVAGSLADRIGRKKMSIAYAVIYAAACATKHSSNFNVLMLGRLLGGMSTSLLFCVFESWVGSEHSKRGFSDSLLGDLFSLAAFFGSGVAAIAAGLVASLLVETLSLGKTAPFDLAIVLLGIGAILVAATWTENYGEHKETEGGGEVDGKDSKDHTVAGEGNAKGSWLEKLGRAWEVVSQSPGVARLGISGALFEGAMYCFVFMWTPALDDPMAMGAAEVPHGIIFACFMGAAMVGTLSAESLMRRVHPTRYMPWVFAASTLLLGLPVILSQTMGPSLAMRGTGLLVGDTGISGIGQVTLLGFVCYEATVGIFWPTMMKLRSELVPDDVRATVISMFRMPVNLLVCAVMWNVGLFSIGSIFALCMGMVALAAFLISGLPQPGAKGKAA